MTTNGKPNTQAHRDPVRPPDEIGHEIENLASYIGCINYLAEAGLFLCHEGPGGERKQQQCMIGVLEGISAMTARARDLANAYGPELWGLPVHHDTLCRCAYCDEAEVLDRRRYRWSAGEPAAPHPAKQ